MNFHGQHVHCVGIGGAGVQALAEFLLQSGASVSGSDLIESDVLFRLRQLGADVATRHDASNVPPHTNCLVFSPAIPSTNPERVIARERGIRERSYPEMLGRLMADRTGVAVSGTHGKSTTTGMVGWILSCAGLDPTVIVGAGVPQLGGPSRVGRGQPFVAESCEFGRSFHHLRPRAAAVLNVEPDHLDYYRGLDEIIESFAEFVSHVPANGLVVAEGQSAAVTRAVAAARAPVETFSLDAGSSWWAADLRNTAGYYRFRVFHHGEYFGEMTLQVPGTHNIKNALAATALAHWLGVPARTIRESLEEFRGCSRRFEFRGHWRGVTLIDDYAHHPSEIRATLAAARERFGRRRIWCVFQPHQLSRTQALFDEFAGSFGAADRVLLAGIYTARERDVDAARDTGRRLAAAVQAAGTPVRFLPHLAPITAYLEKHLEPADVLVTMGAGDIWKVADAFARRLSRHRQAG